MPNPLTIPIPGERYPHDYDEWKPVKPVKSRAQYYIQSKRKEIDTIEGRIQRKELIPVTGRTRVPRNGSGRIVVSLCGREVRVYHLSWSALSCECGEKHEKADFFVVNPNPNPPDNDDPYHDRPCLECGEVVEQIGVGRPRIVCEGKCAKKRNIDKTIKQQNPIFIPIGGPDHHPRKSISTPYSTSYKKVKSSWGRRAA